MKVFLNFRNIPVINALTTALIAFQFPQGSVNEKVNLQNLVRKPLAFFQIG